MHGKKTSNQTLSTPQILDSVIYHILCLIHNWFISFDFAYIVSNFTECNNTVTRNG